MAGNASLRRTLSFVDPGRLRQAQALLFAQGITPDRFGSLYRRKLQEFAGYEAGAMADQAGQANLAEDQRRIDTGGSLGGESQPAPGRQQLPRFRADNANSLLARTSPFDNPNGLAQRSDFGSLYRPIRRY